MLGWLGEPVVDETHYCPGTGGGLLMSSTAGHHRIVAASGYLAKTVAVAVIQTSLDVLDGSSGWLLKRKIAMPSSQAAVVGLSA